MLYGREESVRLAGSAERVVPSLLKKMPDGSEEELDDGALIRLRRFLRSILNRSRLEIAFGVRLSADKLRDAGPELDENIVGSRRDLVAGLG
ncbi:MAG TPA: hypothetical protein VN728_09505 [Stellaceae bacterium]|nr:hypothetical protein [Stellaceae bacterium]